MSGYFMAVKSAIAKAIATLSASIAGSGGAGMVGFKQSGTGAVKRTAQEKIQEVVSVKDFGAVGDGVTDDTAAFRLACKSTEPMAVSISNRSVYVPPGKYKITDTVYVRSGNVLFGDGMASYINAASFPTGAAKPVFKMGYGLVGGVEVIDNDTPGIGDLPPECHSMFVLGGPGDAAVFDLRFPGGLIHDVWLSAPGVGVYLAGGQFYDSQIDMGLVGVVLAAPNQVIENIQFFNQNYAINVNASAHDSVINNCKIEYPKYEGISINADGVKGLKINDCNFFMNEQYATFSQMIVMRNNNQEVHFSGCTFSNHKNYAIYMDGTGSGKKAFIESCVFRGDKTVSAYNQSTTAAGVAVVNGAAVIQACTFQNLRGFSLNIGSNAGTANAVMQGCTILGNAGSATDINISSTTDGDTLSLYNVNGSGVVNLFNANANTYPVCVGLSNWLKINDNGMRKYVEIPIVYGALIDFNLFVNMSPTGDFRYRKNKRILIDAYTEYNGAYRTFLQAATLIASPIVTFGALDLVAELVSIGGGTNVTPPLVGNVVVHWPNTYGAPRYQAQLVC